MEEGQVKAIVDEIKQVLTASSSRKRERAERTKAEDFDAEEGELLKEENEQEEELFEQVCVWLFIFKLTSFWQIPLLLVGICSMYSMIQISRFAFVIQVGDLLGTLIKTFKAAFLPFFDELTSYVTPMWVSFYCKI